MRQPCLIALFWLLSFVVAEAQPAIIRLGQNPILTWTHDGLHALGYRIYIDDVRVAEIPLSTLVSGSARHTLPASTVTTRGLHTAGVAAYNADEEGQRVTISFEARNPAPSPPGNLQFVITVALNDDGTMTFRWTPAQ